MMGNENDLKNMNSRASRFQSVEIEFGDGPAPGPKSAPIQKLYGGADDDAQAVRDFAKAPPKTRSNAYLHGFGGGISMSCRIDEWGKGFTLFGDFVRDAKKYYKKTCINAGYVYFFSYRPMYRELSHEQLCWYLFWRSKLREGAYPKTGLSYIFLYLYEQINLSDEIGAEKVYANIVAVWKNYRAEFPRIDKYIAEWLIDFSLISGFKIDLGELGGILPDIINAATIPEIYLPGDFFKNKGNAEAILKNLSAYDYKKSKFYAGKNAELFDHHIAMMLHAVLAGPEFEALIKKEADEGATLKTTRESYMGAVCAYEHKKRITVEYKNIYKNFYIRQCVTDTVRCAENALRDFLGIKSKLALAAYPGQLAEALERYKAAHLTAAKNPAPARKKEKQAPEAEQPPAPAEFCPDMQAAAEIEKESWETTMTLVELQNSAGAADYADEADDTGGIVETQEDGGGFIAIDTGNDEDIFDILAREAPETNVNEVHPVHAQQPTAMGKFLASLSDPERDALEILLGEAQNKSFDALCGEFWARQGEMLESVIDSINEKAVDLIGDIVFDTAARAIIEDYREEIIYSKDGIWTYPKL